MERGLNFCVVSAVSTISIGGLGMIASFLFLASGSVANNTAGAAGFVAGAVFVAGGLVSLTLVATRRLGVEDRG